MSISQLATEYSIPPSSPIDGKNAKCVNQNTTWMQCFATELALNYAKLAIRGRRMVIYFGWRSANPLCKNVGENLLPCLSGPARYHEYKAVRTNQSRTCRQPQHSENMIHTQVLVSFA
jgi:hypothetical protein